MQWAPTEDELREYLVNPESYSPAFLPRYPPTNALVVTCEENEIVFGAMNSLHLLENGKKNVWSQDVTNLPLNHVYFGFSRKFDCVISCPLFLSDFPYDTQSLHVFFETNLTTSVVRLSPTFLYEATLDIELGSLASAADFKIVSPIMEFNAFGQNK